MSETNANDTDGSNGSGGLPEAASNLYQLKDRLANERAVAAGIVSADEVTLPDRSSAAFDRQRPVPGGSAVGPAGTGYGTLGVPVRVRSLADLPGWAVWDDDVQEGDLLITTNRHVLDGDLGQAVFQPGHRTDPNNRIGELVGYGKLGWPAAPDIAFIRLDEGVEFGGYLDADGMGESVHRGDLDDLVGDTCRLTGATSGVAEADVQAAGQSANITYGGRFGTVEKRGLLKTGDNSQGGDSGSPTAVGGALVGDNFASTGGFQSGGRAWKATVPAIERAGVRVLANDDLSGSGGSGGWGEEITVPWPPEEGGGGGGGGSGSEPEPEPPDLPPPPSTEGIPRFSLLDTQWHAEKPTYTTEGGTICVHPDGQPTGAGTRDDPVDSLTAAADRAGTLNFHDIEIRILDDITLDESPMIGPFIGTMVKDGGVSIVGEGSSQVSIETTATPGFLTLGAWGLNPLETIHLRNLDIHTQVQVYGTAFIESCTLRPTADPTIDRHNRCLAGYNNYVRVQNSTFADNPADSALDAEFGIACKDNGTYHLFDNTFEVSEAAVKFYGGGGTVVPFGSNDVSEPRAGWQFDGDQPEAL